MTTLQESKEALKHKLMLHMMNQIEQDPGVSQRTLSSNLGVAIGLVNSYLKRCVQKGWIKVQSIPACRYAYYLTPKGFLEKTRLTTEYLAGSFKFFRDAQSQCLELYQRCEENGWYRLVLVGEGDLAEIAILVSKKTQVNLIGIILTKSYPTLQKCSIPVITKLSEVSSVDAVLITDVMSPQSSFESFRKQFPEERIFTPPLLHISRSNISGVDA